MNYITQGNSLSVPSPKIELFILDATLLGGITYYLTNSNPENPYGISVGSTNGITYNGNNHISFPLELQGVDYHGDGTPNGKPTLAVSEANEYFLAAILSHGDLVGMSVKRIKTFYTFCDHGATPDLNQHYPIQTWIITQKMPSNKNSIQWMLSDYLDRPGVKLPRAQVLVDAVGNNVAFPGVSRIMQ